jgi:hypothetical protein
MKNIILVLLSFQLLGCVTLSENLSGNKGNGYDITKISNKNAYGSVSIEYKPYKLLIDAKTEKLKNKFASELEIKNASSNIPLGGQVIININRSTIGAANTEYFLYVFTKDGKEVFRKKGSDSIAEVPFGPGGMWWNLSVINIQKDFGSEISLFVIDELSGGRDEFTIKKPVKK